MSSVLNFCAFYFETVFHYVVLVGLNIVIDPSARADRRNMTSPSFLAASPMENPALFNDIKIEPPEELLESDFNMPQVEPVDRSLALGFTGRLHGKWQWV